MSIKKIREHLNDTERPYGWIRDILLENFIYEGITEFFTENGKQIEYEEMYWFVDFFSYYQCKLKHEPGVYMWFNVRKKKGYVGSSKDLATRRASFTNIYSDKCYSNKILEEDRINYSSDFVFLILEKVSDLSILKKREEFYIDKYDTIRNGYNQNHANFSKYDRKNYEQTQFFERKYNELIERIKRCGMEVGETLTLEGFCEKFVDKNTKFITNSIPDNISFRLSCMVKKKNVVELSDLETTNLQIIDKIEQPTYSYNTSTCKYPNNIIKYVKGQFCWHNKEMFYCPKACFYNYFETVRQKLIKTLESQTNSKQEYINMFKNMSMESLIPIFYLDGERIIKFLNTEYERTEKQQFS